MRGVRPAAINPLSEIAGIVTDVKGRPRVVQHFCVDLFVGSGAIRLLAQIGEADVLLGWGAKRQVAVRVTALPRPVGAEVVLIEDGKRRHWDLVACKDVALGGEGNGLRPGADHTQMSAGRGDGPGTSAAAVRRRLNRYERRIV